MTFSARKTASVLADILTERSDQDDKWGEQNHPDGTGRKVWVRSAEAMKIRNDEMAKRKTLTFKDILEEEVVEAFAETDPVNLRMELVQVAAVAVAWIEAIDRRAA